MTRPMRLVLGSFAILGCGGEASEADVDDDMGASADELSASTRYVNCTNLTKGNGFDDVSHLRVRASKVVWNETKKFIAASGALTTPRGSSKAYFARHFAGASGSVSSLATCSFHAHGMPCASRW